jgi:SAM-dependent methyltransferase
MRPRTAGSLGSIARYLARHSVPALEQMRRRRRGETLGYRLPALPEVATARQRLMYEAWDVATRSDASAPGVSVAYYSLTIDGLYPPGERPWQDRWAYLSGLADYRDKRILELGCNMGLLSTHLLVERDAAAVYGVDHDERILQSAALVASAYRMSPQFEEIELDSSLDWETKFRNWRPDIVFALNVPHWVIDQDRLLAFLATAPVLIFEGHDDFETEKQRLESAGLVDVKLCLPSERARPVIMARGAAAPA